MAKTYLLLLDKEILLIPEKLNVVRVLHEDGSVDADTASDVAIGLPVPTLVVPNVPA
jgi:hypothetical protein